MNPNLSEILRALDTISGQLKIVHKCLKDEFPAVPKPLPTPVSQDKIVELKRAVVPHKWKISFANRKGKSYCTIDWSFQYGSEHYSGGVWNYAGNVVKSVFPKAEATSGGASSGATYRLNP